MSSLVNWQKNEQKLFVFCKERTFRKHKNDFGNAPVLPKEFTTKNKLNQSDFWFNSAKQA
jgi:hypothetical protein